MGKVAEWKLGNETSRNAEGICKDVFEDLRIQEDVKLLFLSFMHKLVSQFHLIIGVLTLKTDNTILSTD